MCKVQRTDESYHSSIASSSCNRATFTKPRSLHIAGLNVEKDFDKIVSSADSLNIGGNMQGAEEDTSRKVDTLMQGSENQESPRAGSTHSSISSPISLMHDTTTATSPTSTAAPQTTNALPVTLPQVYAPAAASLSSHQILIDPATGQHFLISSAPPPPHPQIIYQPIYYSTTPAQPVYYHPFTSSGTHGAYVVAATPITTSQAGSQIASSHIALGQRFSSTPLPSTVGQSTSGCFVRNIVDFDDTSSTVTTDERHAVFEHRYSSNCMSARGHVVDTEQIFASKNSVLSQQSSHVSSQSCSIFDNLAAVPVSNPRRTSAQMCTQGTVVYQEAATNPVISTGHAQVEEGARTPLFGAAPAWWGEDSISSVQTLSDGDNVRNAASGNAHRPLKAIRMDIDLNDPFISDEAKDNKSKAAQRTSSSTAFTVSFDNEEDSQKANLSLQDAAKKTSSRRFMRRSMPTAGLVSKGTAAKIAGLAAASSDPKQYLLNKMLMGVREEHEEGPDLIASCEQGGRKPDTEDTLSEAGTYVVDDDHTNQMVTSQTVKDFDAESVSSESTTTRSTENLRSAVPLCVGSVLPQINENVTGRGDEHRLRELLHLNSGRISERCSAGKQVIPSTLLSSSSRLTAATETHVGVARRSETSRIEERQHSSHRLCTMTPSSRAALSPKMHHTQSIAGASGINDNTFRRGDGGRFSMRFSGINNKSHQSSAVDRNDRPPFRVGASGKNQKGGMKSHKESAEMAAWLRRKDYNPMKAAAEAKKSQQLKTRVEKFASNRSISFHQGTALLNNVSPVVRDSSKARHNRSQDDLSADNAACGPETILVNYSKGVTRDLNKLRSVEATKMTRIDSLENAVRQLTMKCNRSIELIKNSHQGYLSSSVENLLEMAIKPVNDRTGTVTEQLDRLSAAFDAIQKYLEVSSASLPASPSGSSPTASVTAPSTSPSRRPCSAYQSKLAAAKRSPLSGQKSS